MKLISRLQIKTDFKSVWHSILQYIVSIKWNLPLPVIIGTQVLPESSKSPYQVGYDGPSNFS
jgi:hypothetical protein